MDDLPDLNDPLADARQEFRAFYTTATDGDAALMDALIHVFTALHFAINHPRRADDPLRDQLEKVTDATERAFIAAREAVRACPTFRNLCAGDQRRIENVLFSPFPPWEK